MSGDQFLELLCSPMKIERDRAASELLKYLPTAETRAVREISESLIDLLQSAKSWEPRHGALLGVKCIVPHLKQGEGNADEFIDKCKVLSVQMLTDAEVRVRLAAGEVLGELCKCFGSSIYSDVKDVILDLIRNNLERKITEDTAASQSEMAERERLMEKLTTHSDRGGADAAQIFHDTAGWKSLETSMKALQCVIDGCGPQFDPWINQELLDMVFQTLMHMNRFVRETGFYVCASLIACGTAHSDVTRGADVDSSSSHEDSATLTENSAIFVFGHQLSKYLGIGLSDNWSQVRLAAATATRKFLTSLSENARQSFYPELLPKLCLNRYYLAEGVRLYSQETWRQIAGTEGRQLVQNYIDDVVKYYISQTAANNHAVREGSCSCIAELAVKLDRNIVQPYVTQLLGTLLVCFQDESWPVRDSACLACGNFILSFPEESRSSLDALYPLFFANLEDNIASVRQGAAASLINLVKAYGKDVLAVIVEKATSGLKEVEKQPAESEKYSDLAKGPATFGVAKRLRDNDMELHSNQTMYSCGSLAPKMGRGAGCSGCLERSFRRPVQPWEVTDGSIYLVAELSNLPEAQTSMPDLVNQVVQASTYRHYTHHLVLLETLCKQIPLIAKGMGKRAFKAHLDALLEPIFYALSSENALTSSAASQCLNQLGSILGPTILRSRVEQYDSRFLQQLDANIHIAPF